MCYMCTAINTEMNQKQMVFCRKNPNMRVWSGTSEGSVRFISLFQWKDVSKALISCRSLWIIIGCFIPTGAPGRTYLDVSGRRSEEGLPQVCSLNKESCSQSWGGGERGPLLSQLPFLLPGTTRFCISFMQQEYSPLHRAGPFLQLTPFQDWSFWFICLFLFLIPALQIHEMWAHDSPELPPQMSQVSVPHHFTLSSRIVRKLLSAGGIFEMIHFLHWLSTESKHKCRWELLFHKR